MRCRLRSATTRAIAVSTIMALAAHGVPVSVYAGEPAGTAAQVAAGRTTVENVNVAFSGGAVTITYDTPIERQGTFDVTLEVSTNGGQTFDVQPRSMSGDIGRPVPAGRGKQIVWEFAKDLESLQTNQFRFRVVIRLDTRSEPPAAAPPETASQTPARVQPAPLPPAVVSPAPRGNRLLWPGLGLFGAGGALAAMAGAGPLRKKTTYRNYYELTPNKGAMYGGIGVGATGLLLVLLGRRGGAANSAAAIVPIPGGVMLYRTTTF